MIIANVFTIDAPHDAVAAFFLDPKRFLYCVPGVENVDESGNGEFRAALKAKLGPIKASFSGQVKLDASAMPDKLIATGEGKDSATGSLAKVVLEATLTAIDAGTTRIESRADISIRGRLGQFGTGVIQAMATEMIGQFSACATARVLDNAEQAAASPTASTPNLASIAMKGIAKSAVSKFRRSESE